MSKRKNDYFPNFLAFSCLELKMPFLLSLTLGCCAELPRLLKILVPLCSPEVSLFPNEWILFLEKLDELYRVHLVHQLPIYNTRVRLSHCKAAARGKGCSQRLVPGTKPKSPQGRNRCLVCADSIFVYCSALPQNTD